ncbi:M48 family metallopeptidase [Puniceibacterium sp. IMCC21224]|uniref:M48 family metallopeptidase n=1 Tax=Puniceibacterium sp. IMCC21224 TaxID=1618204 RepID=UPI00064D93E9|nr:M48 family metallopeptidase [Puniceibacterium sp. IMCC21224]KMK65788.1 Peptidase family M48 [Puniceibacterium sp. IMCC21224]
MRWLIPLFCLALSGCAVPPSVATLPIPGETSDETEIRTRAQRAARTFVQVVDTVEPVAEQECRRIAPRMNCDFLIVVDDRPGQEPNAFQTVARDGRPIVAFNLALIASAQNADELAFVMGHESAHHILGHLARTQQNATVGAVIFSGLAAMSGASAESVRSAEEFGAAVGARTYSKEFELEADQLGTIISVRSGFDPVRGAAFFARIPDPGNRFLGSHPPNAARVEVVRRTVAGL